MPSLPLLSAVTGIGMLQPIAPITHVPFPHAMPQLLLLLLLLLEETSKVQIGVVPLGTNLANHVLCFHDIRSIFYLLTQSAEYAGLRLCAQL